MENYINKVYTIKEASEVWNISVNTIKSSCLGQKGLPPRFKENECRKSEGTWLITYEGMTRLYGEIKTI